MRLWHFIDGPTFEVTFYKWARFDIKRSTKVCALDDVYNLAAVEVSKMKVLSAELCREREGLKYASAMKGHRSNIKFKVQIKVKYTDIYTIHSIKYIYLKFYIRQILSLIHI